jgi:hypothetical protein
MRPMDLNYNVIELKAGDLGNTKAAATGQTDDDTVPSVVGGSASSDL